MVAVFVQLNAKILTFFNFNMNSSKKSLRDYMKTLSEAFPLIDESQVNRLMSEIYQRLDGQGSIFILGNGGSAANAHHVTGDYTKTFALKKQRLRIECLSDNNCYITAASNDIDFSEIYEVLIGTKILPGDLIILLSGSGNSMNLVKAARAAIRNNVVVASIVAYSGGALLNLSSIPIHIPVADMEIAEDFQMIIMHHIKQALCAMLDDNQPDRHQILTPKYSKRIADGLVS